MGRIIGIDFGIARTGIAVTDPDGIIASDLGVMHSSEVIPFLTKYSQTEPISCIVIGLPQKLNGETSQTELLHIRPFIIKLQESFPNIPIEREDERFTSVIAQQALHMMTQKRKIKQQKQVIDQISAVLILQSYLSRKQYNKA